MGVRNVIEDRGWRHSRFGMDCYDFKAALSMYRVVAFPRLTLGKSEVEASRCDRTKATARQIANQNWGARRRIKSCSRVIRLFLPDHDLDVFGRPCYILSTSTLLIRNAIHDDIIGSGRDRTPVREVDAATGDRVDPDDARA